MTMREFCQGCRFYNGFDCERSPVVGEDDEICKCDKEDCMSIRTNDVVQFTERHKWRGCLGIVNEVKETGGGKKYLVGVPAPMSGTAYIFDDGTNIERIGAAVLVPQNDEEEVE